MSLLVDAGRLAGADPFTGQVVVPEDVVADLDRLGIERALVASARCLHQDLRAGNAEAARWAEASGGRILPLGIVQPSFYGTSAAALVDEVEQLGMVAVAVHGHPFLEAGEWRSPAVRAIGEAAATRGLALQAVIADVGELGDLLGAWGDLGAPIMVRWSRGHRYRWLAAELAAAERCPSLLLDVGNAASAGMIDLLAERVGPDRLFVATNAPGSIADCAVAVLAAAELDAASRAAVAGGTVLAAIGVERLGSAAEPADEDRVLAAPKVDSHWHHDHWNLGEPGQDQATHARILDAFGITDALTSSVEALTYDMESGNCSTAAWCAGDGRWKGLIVVDPHRPEASVVEIRRRADQDAFVGVKTIQDGHGFRLDDPAYEPILEATAAVDLPLLCHLPGVAEAAAAHPEVTFVAAHANWGRARHLVDLPNVCFDFATGHADAAETRLADFVRLVGAHRVLFGSDSPLLSPAWSLAKLAASALTRAEEDAILRENARRVYVRLS